MIVLLLSIAASAGGYLPPDTATYRVGAVLGSADRVMTTDAAIEVAHTGGRRWTFRVARSTTSVEGRENWVFDSERPHATDPWPVTQVDAISRVPAEILLDKGGRPSAVADTDAWTAAAREALSGLRLPPEADRSGAALVDPEGLLAAYQRDFPGRPPKGTWTRTETVLDVHADRVETCASESADGRTTWRCSGTISGTRDADGSKVILEDGTCSTVLVFDRDGLLTMESRWDATVRTVDGDRERARPVVGRRLVVRQGAPAPPEATP